MASFTDEAYFDAWAEWWLCVIDERNAEARIENAWDFEARVSIAFLRQVNTLASRIAADEVQL
jgi:hypothetical protein